MTSDPTLLTQQSLRAATVAVDPASAGEAGGPGRSWRGQAKLWNNGTARFRLTDVHFRSVVPDGVQRR